MNLRQKFVVLVAGLILVGCAGRPQMCHIGDCTVNNGGGDQVSNPNIPSPTPGIPAPSTPVTGPTDLRIEVSVSKTDGNLSGTAAGADALCPGGFKALIAASDRVACTSPNCSVGGISEHVNWVLKPNTKYVRSDGTEVFTTDANGIVPSEIAVNSITTPALANGIYAWTGMDLYWRIPLENCNNWSSNLVADSATFGADDNLYPINFSGGGCSNSFLIICVEQ